MAVAIKSVKDLFEEVIKPGLCAVCGACVGDCPYLVFYKGHIRLLDMCTRTEGHCYEYCPRTHTDMDAISKKVFGKTYAGSEIGEVKEVIIARSADAKIREKAQYGGTVSTLLSLALSEGLIDKAALAKTDKDKLPDNVIATSAKDVLAGAGSSYMAYPALQSVNRLPRDSKDKLGVVVTPCQAIALAKMRTYPPSQRANIENVSLVLGLFCTWALDYGRFHAFLKENVDLPKVRKFDIPPPPANRFDVYTKGETKSFSLDRVRDYRMPTCAYCLDMTAEFADISVGAVEGIEGWNTVIVRTKRGAEILDLARKKGKLEVDKLPAKNLEHLKEAAMLKKTRGIKEIVKKTGDKNNLMYLGLADGVKEKLLA
jgi:coenzyme F420 hydrogenase subunit beta